jgi:uncharacterized protein
MPRLLALVVLVAVADASTAAVSNSPPLVRAAKDGDRAGVRALLSTADVNAADADGATALHWASYRDDLELADMLLRAGAKVNAANDLGATPLWLACQNGSTEMVRRLLQVGADPNAALLAGETPLMVAARTGAADVVSLLAAKGSNVNARAKRGQTALMWAVAQKHPSVVKVLLEHGADVHARSDEWGQVMAVPPHGRPEYNRWIPHGSDTPLMFAARVGDLESAKLLVAAGANVNDADAWAVSALVLAGHSGFRELVEFLVAKGADVNADAAGFTALHAAVMRRDEQMLATLLARGANPNAPVRTWTPSRRASHDWNFPPELVGATPLWLAARFAETGIIRLLVKHGADPFVVHHASFYAGDPAEPRTERTTTLLAATGLGGGAAWVRPQRVEPEGRMLETVQLLVQLGADVNATNLEGVTALDAATSRKYESVAKFLLEKGGRPGTGKLRQGSAPDR